MPQLCAGSKANPQDWVVVVYSESMNMMLYMHVYQYSCNIEQAILLDLKEAIPVELIADLQDGNGDLQATVKTILDHMEKHYNTLKPRDITRILVDFNKPYNDSLTPPHYFKRQQKCRTVFKKSPEPISDATMVQTSLGHFLQLPHMDKACDDWETGYPTDTLGTWLEFKQFFTKKFFNYQNHQASLSDAGVANSIVSRFHLR